MKKTLGKRLVTFGAAMAVAITVFASAGISSFAYTQTTGTVTSNNVKVRASASTTASQVSSLKNGDTVDIVDEATDSSGYVWYKIYVNKNEFGYVRSDLVSKKGGSSTTTSSTQSAASLPETSVTSTEQRTATVTSDSINVRKGAGTAYDAVGKVTKGNTVTITGEATGTDNKTWYQVSFGDGKTGFVRSDLVAVSDTPVESTESTEAVEGENTESYEGESSEAQGGSSEDSLTSPVGDGAYSLSYVLDESGNGEWFLNNYIDLQKVKVKDLIDYANDTPAAMAALKKSNNNLKKIAIVLSVLAVVLIAGVVILALKLRDSLYYEDEEEEEYDRYSSPRKKNVDDEYAVRKPARDEKQRPSRNQDDERPERPLRRNAEADNERPTRSAEARTVRTARRDAEDDYDRRPSRRDAEEEGRRPLRRADRDAEDDFQQARPSKSPLREAQERQTRRQENRREEEKPAPKRKSRNFVRDDDEFEFEFLDLDD